MEKIKFKFRLYPELEEAHKDHERIMMVSYSAEVQYEETGDEKFCELMLRMRRESEQYDYNIYAPIIFKVLAKIKPKLITLKDEHFTWDDIFGDNYNELDENKKNELVVLLEGGGLTRLEPSYYEFIEIDSHGQEIKTLHKKVKEKHLVTK